MGIVHNLFKSSIRFVKAVYSTTFIDKNSVQKQLLYKNYRKVKRENRLTILYFIRV